MWRSISLRTQNEWKAFYELEPDDQERTDYGLAHIVQVLIRNGKPLNDFMLPFGDREGPAPVQQSIEYQEKLIEAWIIGSNAALAGK